MVAVIGITCFSISQTSRLRRAFQHHAGVEDPSLKSYYPQLGGESFVRSEQWKNYQEYAKHCPQIAEVLSVQITKTSDTSSYVITLRGPDAHTEWPKGSPNAGFERDVCSLWVNGGKENDELQVNSFTAY